jgi:SAM-dependent methyltransferase
MTMDMYKDGYKNIVNIDISDEVIKGMKVYHEKQGIKCEWLEMDATSLKFENESFDVVIDKGTMDAVLCGNDYFVPNRILQEMFRVVKPGNSVLMVSHGAVQSRKFLFESNLYPCEAEVKYRQQKLSPEVNMINVFRSTGKGKSLKQIVEDPELFKFCVDKWQEDCKKIDPVLPGFIKVPFEHLDVEIRSLPKDESNYLTQALLDEHRRAQEFCNSTQKSEESDPTKKKSITRVEDSGYNPPRQNYCFVYVITKVI